LVDGADAKEPLRWLPLSDQPTSPPVGFRGGLLVPGMVGQILAVDAQTGRNLIEPFQPRLEASRQLTWREPALVGDSGVVVTDSSTLYRLAIDEKPAPHLAAAAQAALSSPIVSPLASLGRTVYAVDDRKQVVSFNLPDLAPGKSWPLNSEAAWGPRLVGDVVLVISHDQIGCFDGDQNLRWQAGLEHGPVVGMPLRAGDAIVLATSGGTVYRLATDTGKELGKIELAQPIAAGPLVFKDGLLLVGHDGTLHVVSVR
jgi:outer membrane protein assembly factor BamB